MGGRGSESGARVSGQDGRLVVAIDGPSGVGKSTVAKGLAVASRAKYLNTGSMYRVAALQVLREGVDPADHDATAEVSAKLSATGRVALGTDPDDDRVWLDGEEVSEELRGDAVTAAVSAVSASPQLREQLVAVQRALIDAHDRIVVEGRDIGSVVAPDADLKVFLTASPAARADRRAAQNRELRIGGDRTQVLEDLNRRDAYDASREASPFRQAADALVLDTSELSAREAIERLVDVLEKRRLV
ncbi:cytidylate kinase [Segniliparus rugosus ATCC BAA-974]|uniref:Cytidylate kinase n=1 Tax=Segniliparus rugosus (strain ATCC BAA-974 / DSM 45345 / CCUG 50838 / CIP 108380 / JCM 13579 / CDC 945) TaxID=679197 RepID=E5XNH4_SEGRC|nr:cytidylate kinase [Segniliparus rugosus ATCC BAA-974]